MTLPLEQEKQSEFTLLLLFFERKKRLDYLYDNFFSKQMLFSFPSYWP